MSKILACIAPSSYATAVCDLTAWAASRLKWDVEVLHVVQRKSAVADRHDLSGAIGLGVKSDLLEELTRIEEAQGKLAVERGRALLSGAEDRLRAAGISDVTQVHLHGGIVETIIERESDADLVVMGKRGASSEFASAHIGSKIERVLRASNKPLLVAPQQQSEITHAVLAYDGGKSASHALSLVTNSKLFDNLPIQLIMAGADSPANREQLERATAVCLAAGRSADWSLMPGTPEKAIADYMSTQPTSLLIMGAYGHSPFRNLIVGSTTTGVIRAVQAPILLIR